MKTDPTATTAVVLLTLAAVLACAGGRGARADEARPHESAVTESARLRADAAGAPDPCAAVEFWHAAPWPTPAADSVNCLVATLPRDSRAFVWSNNWYVQPGPDDHCAVGNFDGANCYLGSAPAGTAAFVWDGKAYFTPQEKPEAHG